MTDDFDYTTDDARLRVTKIGYTIPVSCCVLGTCDHEGPTPTRRQRIRLRLGRWWWDNRPRIHRGPCDHSDCC